MGLDLQNKADDFSNFSLSDLDPTNKSGAIRKEADKLAAKVKAEKEKRDKQIKDSLAKLDLTNKNSAIDKLLAKTDLTDKQTRSGLAKDARKAMGQFNKYNIGAIIPRSAALVGIRFNFFGLARKLYPALLTDEELKAKHFDVENAKKVRTAWVKAKQIWTDLGGDVKALEKDVKKGHDKPIFKTKKVKAAQKAESGFNGELTEAKVIEILSNNNEFSNYSGADEVAAYVAIGTAVLGAISSVISKSGASKNPYAAGSKEALTLDTNGDGVPDMNQSEYDAIKKAADEDKAKGLPNADMIIGGDGETIWGLPKYAVIGGGILLGGSLLFIGYKLLTRKKG